MARHSTTLSSLSPLVGDWDMLASVEGKGLGTGHVSFEWLENGAFLVQHASAAALPGAPQEWVENSPFPVTTVIGLDDSNETFSMLHADDRGVARVYQMSIDDNAWKLWRYAPGFSQRFTASFASERRTITGRWESSEDGTTWEPDFDLTYTKRR